MKRIPITDATDAQVFVYARDVLQLDPVVLGKADTRAKLLAVVQPAMADDHVIIEEMLPEVTGQTEAIDPDIMQVERMFGGFDYGPIVVLKIQKTQDQFGQQPADVNVNQRKLTIMRGVLVGVPYSFYLVLAAAYNSVGVQADADGDAEAPILFTDFTNYPLSEVRLPPKGEIEAWHKATKDVVLGGEPVKQKALAA